MENKKLGIFFISKNNYSLFDVWMNRIDHQGYEILNIDEDSTEENKLKGKEICKKYGIHYLDREKKGVHNNLVTASNFFKEKNIEWIIWFQHDCFPVTPNFFNLFNKLILTGKLNDFGVVGFKVQHDEVWQMLSRSPLQQPNQDMWVRYNINQPIMNDYEKTHSVESVAWMVAAINIKQYEEKIIPCDDYQFFHTWDDIAFQFLYNNIHNICIPYYQFSHEQIIKEEHDIPVKSPLAKTKEEEKIREHYYGHFNHHEVWEQRWGFNYDNGKTFEEVKSHYKDTLLYDFYNHNMHNGPLKTFDI